MQIFHFDIFHEILRRLYILSFRTLYIRPAGSNQGSRNMLISIPRTSLSGFMAFYEISFLDPGFTRGGPM